MSDGTGSRAPEATAGDGDAGDADDDEGMSAADDEGILRRIATRRPGVTDEERARRRAVREAFLKEGFKWEPWQKPEPRMVFGMIRHEENHMQLHIRYYRGGYVKAEREIAHRYLEHVISPRESAHDEVEAILHRHGIHDVDVREKEIPRRHRLPMPRTRTPWKPVALGIGAAILGAVLGRREYLKRK